MLGSKPATSAVINIALSGISPNLRDLLMKSSEPLIQDQPFLFMGYIWLSKRSDTFSVAALPLEMTGLPGTYDSRLWTLGSRYNFPRLHIFLTSKRKSFSFFFSYQLSPF